MSIIKVVPENEMFMLDGYVIKKVEYLAEQEISSTKQTATHTGVDGNILGYESTIVKTSVIRLIPNINMDILKENKAVLEKKSDTTIIKENKLKAGESK